MYTLSQSHLSLIKKIISKHFDPTQYQFFIFGSRALGTHEKYSDIDIGIMGKEKVNFDNLLKIIGDFEDSDLPYFVDVTDFYAADESFKQEALKKIIKLN